MAVILIVEDEKLIRKGLAAMVKRSCLPVEEIIEAKNGQEALEQAKTRQIDVLMTDIRMPKMDGIQLVEQIKQLSKQPLVVVVSGYDDFSYAVRMLRNGVQDYLLKPVEQEKFDQCMERIRQLLLRKAEQENRQNEQFHMTINYLMEHSGEDDKRKVALREVEGKFPVDSYQLLYWKGEPLQSLQGNLMIQMDTQVWSCVVQGDIQIPERQVVGVSLPHVGAEQLHQAYQEAQFSWKSNFFSQIQKEYTPIRQQTTVPKASYLMDLIRLSRWEEMLCILRQAGKEVEQERMQPDEVYKLCDELAVLLEKNYRGLYEKEENPILFRSIWNFTNWEDYMEQLSQWLRLFCQRMDEESADYESKQKIRDAVRYVRQNFRNPINMAMVSNHISMNYSLFSVLFKQYTGTNFVTFLQTVRLEEAKRMLAETDMRVNEIGTKSGFSGEKHFLKVFKASTGVSPSDWRKLNRVKKEI